MLQIKTYGISFLFVWLLCIGCSLKNMQGSPQAVKVGAENTAAYLPLLKNKKVVVVCNQTALIGNKHIVDSLLSLGVRISKIFSPEHGFRGKGEAGEKISGSIDKKTGIPIVSLYGKKKKLNSKDLADIDIVLFDIQDVGLRFYTYISTLHYVMQGCAENNLPLIVLDRPNPNAYFIDGPILEKKFTSFVGMHPVPIVYGMTIGEYGKMINGENWLPNSLACKLTVIPLQNWMHSNTTYHLPVKPSPNLPNMTAIYLYPSLCLFEGTVVSIGRGTAFPFQMYGHPAFTQYDFSFTPKPIRNVSTNPKLNDKICYGVDLRNSKQDVLASKKLSLNYMLNAYRIYPNKDKFFNKFFNFLSGNSTLKEQIINGLDEKQIRKSWQKELTAFKKIRKKYLLYP